MQMTVATEAAPRVRRGARVFLTPGQAAVQADVTEPTLRGWCVAGRLRAKKVAGRWRIDPRDLDAMLWGDDGHAPEG